MSNEQSVRLNDCAVLVKSGEYAPMVSFEGKRYTRDEYVPLSILGDRIASDISPQIFTASLFVAWCMAREFKELSEWPALAAEFVFPGEAQQKSGSSFQQSKPPSDT
jgi:hypothetical protein